MARSSERRPHQSRPLDNPFITDATHARLPNGAGLHPPPLLGPPGVFEPRWHRNEHRPGADGGDRAARELARCGAARVPARLAVLERLLSPAAWVPCAGR